MTDKELAEKYNLGVGIIRRLRMSYNIKPRGQRRHTYFVPCANCGKIIEVWKCRLEKYSFVTCSNKCRVEYIRKSGIVAGENNKRWKGGDIQHYRGPNWHKQRKLARERDNHICKYCGTKENGRMHSVHHIIPFSEFDDYKEANKLENLITLCQPCHMYLHYIHDINSELYYDVLYDLQHPDEMEFDVYGVWIGK